MALTVTSGGSSDGSKRAAPKPEPAAPPIPEPANDVTSEPGIEPPLRRLTEIDA